MAQKTWYRRGMCVFCGRLPRPEERRALFRLCYHMLRYMMLSEREEGEKWRKGFM
jgi:hypothetical protein